MVHKLRVTDPRQSGLSQITVDGHALSFNYVGGGQWESGEFVVTDAAAAQNWSVSQTKVPVSATAGTLEVAYNPKKSVQQLRMRHLPAHLRTNTIIKFDEQLQAIGHTLQQDIEANGANSWVKKYAAADVGKYGKEVQAQMNPWAALQPQLQSQVYVNVRTGRVEH